MRRWWSPDEHAESCASVCCINRESSPEQVSSEVRQTGSGKVGGGVNVTGREYEENASLFGLTLHHPQHPIPSLLTTLIAASSASRVQTLLMQPSMACKAPVESCSHHSFSAALNFPPRSPLGFSAVSTSIAGILKCFHFLLFH